MSGSQVETDAAAEGDAEMVIDESEVEDLGRRLQAAGISLPDYGAAELRRLTEGGGAEGALSNVSNVTEVVVVQNISNVTVRARTLVTCRGLFSLGCVLTPICPAVLQDTGPVLLDPMVLPLVKVKAKGVVSIRSRDTSEYMHHVSRSTGRLWAVTVAATLTTDRCCEQVDHMSYFPEAYGAKISDSDIGRLRSVLTAVEPVADIIQLRMWGR